MKHWKLAIALVLLGLLVIFSIQNAEELQVRILFWTVTTRRAFMLFIILAIGIVVGWVLHGLSASRRQSSSRDPAD